MVFIFYFTHRTDVLQMNEFEPDFYEQKWDALIAIHNTMEQAPISLSIYLL